MDMQSVTVHCSTCKQPMSLADSSVEVSLGDRYTQVGLECKECGTFVHCYFDSKALAEKRKSLAVKLTRFRVAHTSRKDQRWKEYQAAKDSFRREFEDLQNKLISRLKQKETSGEQVPT